MSEDKKSISWRIIIFVGVACFIIFGAAFVILNGYGSYKSPRNARIVAAINQTRIEMNHIYCADGSYDNFHCMQGDMILWCEEIDKNYQPKDGKEPTITHDTLINSKAACIYSPMNWKNNYWYCADSTGAAGYTKINPGNPGYCVEGKSATCPSLLKDIS